MKLRKISIAIILFMLIFSAGCKKEENTNKDGKGTDNQVKQEKADGENTYPLTGLQANEEAKQRPVAVMINNHVQARPQSGLLEADIVFEILAEGNITRFLALYQSESPEVVGPVRSAREYYFELAKGYDALYIYHGAAKFVDQMIKERSIEHLNGAHYDNDKILFTRESFRKAPHNSYLHFGAVEKIAEAQGYTMTRDMKSLPFLSQVDMERIVGEDANKVEIEYYKNPKTTVTYEYDADSEKYIRYSDGVKTADLETEKVIELDNILILETPHNIIDDAGRREIDITSGGQAYLLQKGKVQKVQWANQDGYILPMQDGKPLGLVPGKTWINIIPTNPGLDGEVTLSNESL